VVLSDRQDLPADERSLTELARRTLQAERAGAVELSISLVGTEEMAELHRRYLGDAEPTDVLSFTMDEDGLLGDVVICPAVAREQNPDLDSELRLLLVHGILHLLGYDHEDEGDRREMWERQERYSGVAV
jgi:probable rRNA maturation factor